MSAFSGSERLCPAHMMANYVAGRCWIPGKRTPLRPRVLDPQDSWEDPVQPREVSRVSNCAGAPQPLSSITVHAGVRVPGGGSGTSSGETIAFPSGDLVLVMTRRGIHDDMLPRKGDSNSHGARPVY